MKRLFVIYISVILFMAIGPKANAALYLEPYVASMMNTTYTTDSSDGDVSGNSVGARLGFSNMGFAVGFDGRRSNVTFAPETGSDIDYVFTEYGLFLSYDLPMMFRIWGNYILAGEGVESENTDNKVKKGTGISIGVGYKVLSIISLNLESFSMKYTEAESAAGSVDNDFSSSGFLLGISLPLSI